MKTDNFIIKYCKKDRYFAPVHDTVLPQKILRYNMLYRKH